MRIISTKMTKFCARTAAIAATRARGQNSLISLHEQTESSHYMQTSRQQSDVT